ncbi:MAG TPA: acyltransferase [Polyangia bacterium]|nr:acyltransferase [Polyangia bacterium]
MSQPAETRAIDAGEVASPAPARAGWLGALLRPPRTLETALAARQDNFLLLRFVAASFVLFGHSYVLSGAPDAHDFLARAQLGAGVYTGSLAVDIFFVVSGFLITGSYLNQGNLERFLRARFFRLVPAFAALLFASAFVLGPLVTSLPLPDYFTDPATYHYVTKNLRFEPDLQYVLPGLFQHNPYHDVTNGSIWSLPAEVCMYLWVAVLGLATVLRRRRLANALFVVLLVVGLLVPEELPFMPLPVYVRPCGFFMAGMFCYLNRDRIPMRTDLFAGLIAACALAHRIPALGPAFPWVFAATIVYGVFWFAYQPRLGFYNRFGDYSYGVFLWGFPMQQLVVHLFGGPTSPATCFWLGWLLTLGCAVASWHLVEKPALRWK